MGFSYQDFMQLESGKRGRPPKTEEEKNECVYSPASENGKRKYAKEVIRAKARKFANLQDEKRKEKVQLILRLQKKYWDEFEILEYTRYGIKYHNPKRPILGTVYRIAGNCTGEKLFHQYFPERITKKEVKKLEKKQDIEEYFGINK